MHAVEWVYWVYNNNLWINQAISDPGGLEEPPRNVFDGLFSLKPIILLCLKHIKEKGKILGNFPVPYDFPGNKLQM